MLTTDSVALLLCRFAEVGAQVSDSYGPRSQARVFVLYEELIALRTVLTAAPHEERVARRVRELRELIGEAYLASAGGAPPPRRAVLELDPPLLEFDRALFERNYRPVAAAVLADTIELRDPVEPLRRLKPGVSHMFVIDDEDRLLVWTRPFELADLLFGRNRATVDGVPVAHPMLVPDRLRARAAGEIVLIGGDRVAMVVANTKSGHFQPPLQSVAVVRETFRRVFGLTDADVDVFHLFPPASPDERTGR
ncbi:hypothetical protein GCM10027598_01710 [Amycolatopsis oliviviridis]|uniref:Uncharacterized protein n=1 Tax=Amycolatopsis oliviviridis TaxID=1471590 RepID=A0ABQ3LS44_9PSEU|nr:hypothetical protein [Amycolatopsis oliviviridis]GHH22429.1 hypothetical protein GCM10017790_44170 [Amycolatopsis oliviviridis]